MRTGVRIWVSIWIVVRLTEVKVTQISPCNTIFLFSENEMNHENGHALKTIWKLEARPKGT